MKLNQILAIEKGVKSRTYGEITRLHKLTQKSELFTGFTKIYRKLFEEGEDYPPDNKRVQLIAEEVLVETARLWTEMFDVTYSKDISNMVAFADVEIEGKILIAHAPVTFLLFLEKQISDIRKSIEALPTLDGADEWIKDDATGMFKTPVFSTHRTKKTQKPIVLYDATDKHPAQTQLLTEDVLAGYWDTVKYSGALPAPRKKLLLERIDILGNAVKVARENANSIEAIHSTKVVSAIFEYLLA